MKNDARALREAQIAEAAHAVLAEKGYRGLSMLAVAKRARASNETLYRWYGDKTGLFRSLIARNGQALCDALDDSVAPDAPLEGALSRVGQVLLDMLMSDSSLALNRAAAADATGILGPVLGEVEHTAIMPRIEALFDRLVAQGHLKGPAAQSASLWFDLLVGDLQIRCATGAAEAPSAEVRAQRVARAEQLLAAMNACEDCQEAVAAC